MSHDKFKEISDKELLLEVRRRGLSRRIESSLTISGIRRKRGVDPNHSRSMVESLVESNCAEITRMLNSGEIYFPGFKIEDRFLPGDIDTPSLVFHLPMNFIVSP